MGKARRLAQRLRLRGEPSEPVPPGTPPGGTSGPADTGAAQAEPGPEDDAAARIDAARARLRATIKPPGDPDA